MTRILVSAWTAPLSLVRAVTRWPVESQLNGRRNALVASTQLAARTHERQQVDVFLDLHTRRWEARQVPQIGHRRVDDGASRLRAAL